MNAQTEFTSIDDYIDAFEDGTQEKLNQLRTLIRSAAPEATEKISYGMPTFHLHGNLIHFAAFKNHIGLYPTPSGIDAFQEELSGYKNAKGSVQFPLDQPLPLDLIRRIVDYRVKENMAKATKKPGKKKA